MAPLHVDTEDCEASMPFINRNSDSSSSSPCQHECCGRQSPGEKWYLRRIDQDKRESYWLTYINIVVLLVLVVTWIQIGREPSASFCPTPSPRDALKLTSQWSPIFDEVDLTPQATVTDGRLYSPSNISLYRGEPSAETDDAWDDLAAEAYEVILVDAATLRRAGYEPEHYFKAPESWRSLRNGRGGEEAEEVTDLFPVQIDVFHQIHCLNAVRKQMHAQHYFPEGTAHDEMHWMHMRHCLHMVLQSLTCSADVDIVPHRWVEADEKPFAQFGVTKKCRNLESLRRWNRENAVKDVKAVWPHDKTDMPADAFVWPGHGEPELEDSYPL